MSERSFAKLAGSLAALALAAVPRIVEAAPPVPLETAPPVFHPYIETEPPLYARQPGDPPEACPKWRWIGIKADPCAPCLKKAGWSVRPLFPEPDRGQDMTPLGLRSFCVYEHPGKGGDLDAAELGLSALAPDCVAVLPAATKPAPAVLQQTILQQEARFLSNAGALVSAPSGPIRVRLSLLDTAPASENPLAAPNPNDASEHGYSLANMAQKLVCAAGTCAARITSQLALPRTVYDPYSGTASAPDPVRGGAVGTIGDLAEAIRREVLAWQQPGQPEVLLLNLSLGWNGRRFGGLEPDLAAASPAVQAVHAALADAVCRGASVLAAAGNRSWGPDPDLSRGPLLPAAWEARAAPSAAACRALSPAAPPSIPAGGGAAAYRPLVHAVGAVRSSGQPLENSRFFAEPRLVAFGDHAAVGDRFGEPTAMLTGTSVSAVIAAAALAWVRHQDPALGPDEAVERLHQYGLDRGRGAAFCLGGNDSAPCPGRFQVRQVQISATARGACQSCAGAGCRRPCPSPDTRPSLGKPYSLAAIFSAGRRIDARSLLPARPQTDAACPMDMVPRQSQRSGALREQLYGLPAQGARCPHWQFFDANLQAETGPQPGSNPCSACTLEPDGAKLLTAYVQVDPGYRAGDLSSAVLKVGNQTFALGKLRPGEKLVVEKLPAAVPPEKIQISFQVNGGRSATSLFFVP